MMLRVLLWDVVVVLVLLRDVVVVIGLLSDVVRVLVLLVLLRLERVLPCKKSSGRQKGLF